MARGHAVGGKGILGEACTFYWATLIKKVQT